MYGLVIEGLQYYIIKQYGADVMKKVAKAAQLDAVTFSTHERYSEKVIPNMLTAVVQLTGESVEMCGILAGRYFVQFMIINGYGELLRVMGRKFSDFLKGMDNLHEYFRFSYPKIKPPSFFCSRETSSSVVLHYRSRRRGYIAYVMGQLIEIARCLYGSHIKMQLLKKSEKGSFQFVSIGIRFDNSAITVDRKLRDQSTSLNEYMPVDSAVFLKMFPFFIAFSKDLTCRLVGSQLATIMPELLGSSMAEQFDLQRPAVKFTAEGVLAHLNCLFQMESLFPIQKKQKQKAISFAVNDAVEDNIEVDMPQQEPEHQDGEDDDAPLPYLVLKGPLLWLKKDDMFVYLPTVVVSTLDEIFHVGLFLQDYGDADCNKEIIMSTVQKSDDLKDMLHAEKERSIELGHMMKEIEITRKTARDLLCSMLPRTVANELLSTGMAKSTCETYDSVTLAFVKVCDFLSLTSKLDAVQIVSLLNTVYSSFDEIITRHGVYKVETIGESYMISAGIPIRNEYHAEYIADTALDIVNEIKIVDFPPLGGRGKIQVKCGINTGSVVGGVVGERAPRFCLFGDTVNTASRMESHNKMPMTIMCGQSSKDSMEQCAPGKFKFKHRGVVNLKGKGETKTYTLVNKAGRPRYMTNPLMDTSKIGEGDDADAVVADGDDDVPYTPMDDDGRSTNASRMSFSAMTGSQAASRMSDASRMSQRSGFQKDNDPFGLKDVPLDNQSPVIDSATMPDIGAGSNLEELIAAAARDQQLKEEMRQKEKKEAKKGKKSKSGSTKEEAIPEEAEPAAPPAENGVADGEPAQNKALSRPGSGKTGSRPSSRSSRKSKGGGETAQSRPGSRLLITDTQETLLSKGGGRRPPTPPKSKGTGSTTGAATRRTASTGARLMPVNSLERKARHPLAANGAANGSVDSSSGAVTEGNNSTSTTTKSTSTLINNDSELSEILQSQRTANDRAVGSRNDRRKSLVRAPDPPLPPIKAVLSRDPAITAAAAAGGCTQGSACLCTHVRNSALMKTKACCIM